MPSRWPQTQIQVKISVLNVVLKTRAPCGQQQEAVLSSPEAQERVSKAASDRVLKDDLGVFGQRAGVRGKAPGQQSFSERLFVLKPQTPFYARSPLEAARRGTPGALPAVSLLLQHPRCRPSKRRIPFTVTLAELPADLCAVRKERARNGENACPRGLGSLSSWQL